MTPDDKKGLLIKRFVLYAGVSMPLAIAIVGLFFDLFSPNDRFTWLAYSLFLTALLMVSIGNLFPLAVLILERRTSRQALIWAQLGATVSLGFGMLMLVAALVLSDPAAFRLLKSLPGLFIFVLPLIASLLLIKICKSRFDGCRTHRAPVWLCLGAIISVVGLITPLTQHTALAIGVNACAANDASRLDMATRVLSGLACDKLLRSMIVSLPDGRIDNTFFLDKNMARCMYFRLTGKNWRTGGLWGVETKPTACRSDSQTIRSERTGAFKARSFTLIVDGSASLDPFVNDIAAALDRLGKTTINLSIARRIGGRDVKTMAGLSGPGAARELRQARKSRLFSGGADNMPALERAFNTAGHSRIIWIHGPQPAEFGTTRRAFTRIATCNRTNAFEVEVLPGPNVLRSQFEKLEVPYPFVSLKPQCYNELSGCLESALQSSDRVDTALNTVPLLPNKSALKVSGRIVTATVPRLATFEALKYLNLMSYYTPVLERTFLGGLLINQLRGTSLEEGVSRLYRLVDWLVLLTGRLVSLARTETGMASMAQVPLLSTFLCSFATTTAVFLIAGATYRLLSGRLSALERSRKL